MFVFYDIRIFLYIVHFERKVWKIQKIKIIKCVGNVCFFSCKRQVLKLISAKCGNHNSSWNQNNCYFLRSKRILPIMRTCAAEMHLINRLRAIWPKGYQHGSLRKSHQNGDFLKASNAKKLTSRRNRTCSLRFSGPLLYHLS